MNSFRKTSCKILSLILALVFVTASLVSCMGESAYEIAVRNGFDGSEREWLDSLKGENGEDGKNGEDGTDGKDGENGTDGENGKDGLSSGSDAAKATAFAIRSAVSIFCTFEKYQYAGYGRDPIATEYSSAGAGVVYKFDKESGDAYIITNYHVVHDADSISSNGISEKIKLYLYGMHYEEMHIEAEFVGGSSTYDIALLKVEGSEMLKSANVKEITLANSDDVTEGSLALAIGNPESKGISVTSGIVSVNSEYVKMNSVVGSGTTEMRLMRIDTPVNHGNSGGGLFNENGHLVGIVNAKLESSDIENMGYAIPSNIVYAVAENIINNYENKNRSGVYKATVGIVIKMEESYSVYDEENEKTLIHEKVVVSEVSAGSAAEGKLKVGDVLVKISCADNVRDINRRFTAIDFILSLGEGDEVTFTVERDGVTVEEKLTLDASLFSRVA